MINLVTKCCTKGLSLEPACVMINAAGGAVRPRDSPTMMCRAEVTGSLVPTVAKQIQSVEPETSTSCKEMQEFPRLLWLQRSALLPWSVPVVSASNCS